MSSFPHRASIAGSPDFVAREIEDFDVSIQRFQQGLIPEPVFLENRLRQGVYGQRQDGVHMLRSKLPLGLISPDQMDAFADIAELYGHGVAHLTTRQDIQVHFVPLERTPGLMRVLADADMTSKEACGNVVRNLTASDVAGVDPAEAFDVTPYGVALARYLLRLPDGQGLGRKFKPTLSSSFDPRFNLDAIHDLAATAVLRDGRRGFHVRVGGGLGAVAHEAQVLYPFLEESELLPVAHAILRVFAEHGEKKNRARARMKFVVARFGIDRFRELVEAERAKLPEDAAWTAHLNALERYDDQPLHPPATDFPQGRDEEETQWLRTNVLRQKQDGYAAVKVRVPRGDLSPDTLRALARILRTHVGDTTRIGADQSLRIRFVPFDRLLALRDALKELGLAAPRAGGLGDTVTCPGADTCKLGITTPRAAARAMQGQLDVLGRDPRLEHLRIHISGCPNACAQHQIGDIGFFGGAKTVDGRASPQYVLLLGGLLGGGSPEDAERLGEGFGTTVGKIPAARIGDAIEALTELYLEEGEEGEAFGRFAKRLGRARLKKAIEPLTRVPSFEEAPHYYSEHGADEGFEVRRGKGECAGEVVLVADLLLADADREADQAVEIYDNHGDEAEVVERAKAAFELAARALLSTEGLTNPREFDTVEAFRKHFYDTGLIFEGVGHAFLAAFSEDPASLTGDRLRRLVTEAGLFVEEAHTYLSKARGSLEQGAAK